jgi:hypothetical protein
MVMTMLTEDDIVQWEERQQETSGESGEETADTRVVVPTWSSRA